MKIIDLKCALLGSNPVVRIVTDEGISGYAEIEMYKPYVVSQVLYYREAIVGADLTDVERVMLRIRNRGAFKPWGSAVSAIEMALWDVAGKAVGPDPCDVGGVAELKWVAEYAHLHGISIAPHGTGDGLLGLAALVQVCATLPANYIAFEYPVGNPTWWYEIVEGLDPPIVKEGYFDVWDRPGMGLEFNVEAARRYLSESDRGFFD
jgi:L-alanine-DL-glutamate epimerase-like enolase superfamily enzyme